MILVKLNGVDITAKVELNTLKITEQMNNRSNTLNLSVFGMVVPESALVEVWEGSEVTAQAAANQATISVDDTYEFFRKYRNGDKLTIPAGGTGAITRTIQSVNHTNKTITFTANLDVVVSEFTKVGRLIFAGITQKNPDSELDCDTLIYRLTAVDWTRVFDQKNVVDTFLSQYPREIIGRITHKFVATDSKLEISDAETTTGWTNSGVARALGTTTTDKVWKTASLTGGATGAGTVTYRYTPGSAVNASAYTHLRTWTKIGAGQLVKLTNPKVRAYTDASNYFEWTDAVQVEDCWNYDSFKFTDATKTGTPNQASIAYFEYQWTATTSVPQDGILIDQLQLTTGGFTLKNTMRGDSKFADVRAQFKKPTDLMEGMAKLQQLYWYIDYERDVHFFERESYACPMEVSDTGDVFDGLSVTADTSQLKNRQVVRGGEAVDNSLYTQDEVTDGKMESWRLDYKPKGLEIYISTDGGTTWIPKTVGVKNLDAATDFQYLFDFNEKVVERASDSVLANGVIFRRKYYPYRPIRVQVEDSASILKMKTLTGGDGIFDGPVINDASIRDFTEARSRAKAEIAEYANPIMTAQWTSEQDGWKAGQIVRVQDTVRGIDEQFVIQKVTRQQNTPGRWKYSIQAGSTLFGLIEFFQLLLRKTDKLMIDVSEIVDVVKTIDETIIATDSYIFTRKERPFFATPDVPFETLKAFEFAHFPFLNSLEDISGNSRDLVTVVGGVTTGIGRDGITESAYHFDGTGYVETDATGVEYKKPHSVSMWIKQEIDGINSAASLSFYVFGAIYGYIRNSTNSYIVRYDSAGARQAETVLGAGYREWTHYLATCDGINRLQLYINGELKADVTHSANVVTLQNSGKIRVGAGYFGFFTGSIDKDVAFFNKVLSHEEVLWLYQNQSFDLTEHRDTNTHFSGNLQFANKKITSISGASYTADDFGYIKSAYSFDGNDLITQNNFFAGMGQEFTMGVMVYPTAITAGISNRFIMSTNDRLGVGFDTSGKFTFYVYDTSYRTLSLTSITPTLNAWTHVGVTYKAGEMRFYIDGVYQGNRTGIGTIVAGLNAYIGNYSSLTQGFIGKLDEWEFETTARDDVGMLAMAQRCQNGYDAYADFCEAA